MRCLHCHSPFLPFLSQLNNHKQQLNTGKLVWVTRNEPSASTHNIPSRLLPLRTKAVTTTSLVLGVTSSAAKPVNVSVLLLTSAVFLFMYWIANFVVPEMVLKDLQKPDAEKNTKDEKQSTSTSNAGSQTDKQGFNRTKR